MTDRATALSVLEALGKTEAKGAAVLVGSPGLFGFETEVPALTEDVHVAIPEEVTVAHGGAIVEALATLGYAHEPGTATFTHSAGVTFDLLGHGEPEAGDHIAGGGALRVMVYADLSHIVTRERAVQAAGGALSLTPAGFAPPGERLPSGARVVDEVRLQRELVGAVGPRVDLFALLEMPPPVILRAP